MKKIFFLLLSVSVVFTFQYGFAQKGKHDKWITLFDGKTLQGWHSYDRGNAPVKNWVIEDGSLVCLGAAAPEGTHGDLVTDGQYDNFILEWNWKIEQGSNSGVMYHVVEDKKYHGPPETGPEYQIIDDIGFPEKLNDWQLTGADYAMHPANANKKLKPVGEWNTSKIVFDHGHVEHWLNGEKIVEFSAWDKDWNEKKANGKWKDYPDYGLAKKGVIALQDHGKKTYYKDVRIKVL